MSASLCQALCQGLASKGLVVVMMVMMMVAAVVVKKEKEEPEGDSQTTVL